MILRLIVEEYIRTWDLVGSKSLTSKHDLWVSPATVRNDMAKLEDMELVFQPYNSAWRYPTNKGLRIFINYMMEQKPDYFLAPTQLKSAWESLVWVESTLHKITFDLSNTTWEISFVALEEEQILRYSWISHFIEKNSKDLGESALNIVKVLEEKNTFMRLVSSFNIDKNVTVILGEESNIEYLKDYSIIIRPVEISWRKWYIGLIWSLRMDYSFNISALRGII